MKSRRSALSVLQLAACLAILLCRWPSTFVLADAALSLSLSPSPVLVYETLSGVEENTLFVPKVIENERCNVFIENKGAAPECFRVFLPASPVSGPEGFRARYSLVPDLDDGRLATSEELDALGLDRGSMRAVSRTVFLAQGQRIHVADVAFEADDTLCLADPAEGVMLLSLDILSATPEPSPSPELTPSHEPTATPEPSPSSEPTPSSEPMLSPIPTPMPESSAAPVPTAAPSSAPVADPTPASSPPPTCTPSLTQAPTPPPTCAPTPEPSPAPGDATPSEI